MRGDQRADLFAGPFGQRPLGLGRGHGVALVDDGPEFEDEAVVPGLAVALHDVREDISGVYAAVLQEKDVESH